MPAGTYNISIDQGATFLLTVTWTNASGAAVNLTGSQAHMQVRSQPGATDLELDCSTTGYDGGTGNGYITLGSPDPTDGTINFNVPSAVTAALAPGSYRYDLDVFSANAVPVVTKLLGGSFKVAGGVSVDAGE